MCLLSGKATGWLDGWLGAGKNSLRKRKLSSWTAICEGSWIDKHYLNKLGVSKNNGTPKSSILIGFSIINHPFWCTSIFGNTQLFIVYTKLFCNMLSLSLCLSPVPSSLSLIQGKCICCTFMIFYAFFVVQCWFMKLGLVCIIACSLWLQQSRSLRHTHHLTQIAFLDPFYRVWKSFNIFNTVLCIHIYIYV